MKDIIRLVLVFFFAISIPCKGEDVPIKGWIILSDNMDNAITTIKAAKGYKINHLQLSHQIIHNLMEVKNESVRNQVRNLTRLAHQEGIGEVLVWDHSFYALDYYPAQFKTGPHGTLNMDNPAFWEWFKQDYRGMLDLIPEIDGLVLTFIETGAYAEKQYSNLLKTNEEKLAAVVDAVADDPFIGKINKPTIVEFDTGNEYNGQGVIANTWPEYVTKRWTDFIKRPNVIGYVARTDRYGTTKLVGSANEILLYALRRSTENPEILPDRIYDEYISTRYGKKALEPVKNAFKKAYDIVLSSMYILGTNAAKHSSMDYDPYSSSYDRHVSGRWLEPPVVFVEHGINKEFHYWKDIINHIAPARFKTKDSRLGLEARYVIEQNWVTPVELMDSLYLSYIITEKRYGVSLANEALADIERAKDLLTPSDYDDLYRLFKRTALTAQLYEAVSTAYFGFRIYAKGKSYRYENLEEQIRSALNRIDLVTDEMKGMQGEYPLGQWDWLKDAETALSYKNKILTGWKEYNNVKFTQ